MIFAKRLLSEMDRRNVSVAAFYLRSRTSPGELIREAARFRRALRGFDPDIVHAQYGTMTAFFCALLTALPLVVTFRGSDLNPVPSLTWLRSATARLLSQLASLRTAHVVCVSEQLKRRLWWRREVVTVLPSGVDLHLFYPRPQVEARREIGWDPDRPVVLFNAGLNPAAKRLDLAQAAFAVAKRAVPDARLEILDGSLASIQVALRLSAADCLLMTSDWEGSPTIIQEALATNLPVISVPVGDVPERIQGVSECHVVPRDPEALGTALVRAMARRRRSDGRHRVAALSTGHTASLLIGIYRTIRPTGAARRDTEL